MKGHQHCRYVGGCDRLYPIRVTTLLCDGPCRVCDGPCRAPRTATTKPQRGRTSKYVARWSPNTSHSSTARRLLLRDRVERRERRNFRAPVSTYTSGALGSAEEVATDGDNVPIQGAATRREGDQFATEPGLSLARGLHRHRGRELPSGAGPLCRSLFVAGSTAPAAGRVRLPRIVCMFLQAPRRSPRTASPQG